MLLGISISFCYIYLILDCFQSCFDFFMEQVFLRIKVWLQTGEWRPAKQQNPFHIIITHMQIYLLTAISIYVGALFGFIFAIVDVEDYYAKNSFLMLLVLVEEISFCIPIGMLFGGFAGFMNEFLRQ